ncbi:rhamnogalacturonate lyase B-like [Corylus avellana]|uniref:rhamnogalacturonate lyase B-like n=1 Tax=Corylus avellana TaxID=13451 RepID=UPI00286BA879|nr:rhamnogalacturonate lyase B-like [Corylus avellana]
MEQVTWNRRQWGFLVGCLGAILLVFLLAGSGYHVNTTSRRFLEGVKGQKSIEVKQYTDTHDQLVMVDNGIVQVNFSIPDGHVLGISYNGIPDILDHHNVREDRGYWDVVWNKPKSERIFERIAGANFTIITQNEYQVELSFSKIWDTSLSGKSVALNIDKRYVLRSGNSGYYSYAVFERLEGWPEEEIDQIRIVYKLQSDKFRYMALSDERQRIMPTMDDRVNGQPLAFPEAVLLTNPADSQLKGEVDDKYQYSSKTENNKVHGWISNNPPVGFWIITPSNEFRIAGPTKQELTSHAGPIALSMFVSCHYAGKDVAMLFEEGEPWKKVFGPIFVYLNSASSQNNPGQLWENAKEQMLSEVSSWPYKFTQSKDFLSSDQRGTVAGQLLVHDRYIDEKLMHAKSAYVGLAAPGEVGSWQRESKGYQFWTQADEQGRFIIKNILPGNYNLYAWVPGFIGDYKNDSKITVSPGGEVQMDVLVYEPPRLGPTLWEIGIPDRSAEEFYVPDPYPNLINKLYKNQSTEKFRQYGLWARYADLYREHDLTYVINTSDYRKDWFYAHVSRNINDQKYEPATWKILFDLKSVNNNGNYTLRLALASANEANLEVRFNDVKAQVAHLRTGVIGRENAIARHGIHGLYWFYSIGVGSDVLQVGKNIIYLTQTRSKNPFQGVMYDYLRFEGPPN